jgi:hypothetical protein
LASVGRASVSGGKNQANKCALRRGIANFMTSYFAAIGDFGAARDLSFHNLI